MGLPLDPKLAVLYGKCVNAAYGMYKRDCSVLQPEPNPGDIPDPYELVAWVNMSDFIFDNKLPQFYGYIARNKNDRHDFILAIRGTEGLVEWIDDVFIHLVPFAQVPHAGRVAQGFDQIYSSLKVIRRPHTADGQMKAAAPGPAAAIAAPQPLQVMTGSFLEQIEQLADSLEPPAPAGAMALAPEAKPRRSFVVAGHSLGAALTTLFVIENKEKGMFDITTSCTFASPRVGNMQFAATFNLLPVNSWRIFNDQDVVPRVPLSIPVLADYTPVNDGFKVSSNGVTCFNPVCWHSMMTYLHLLDPTIPLDNSCRK